MTVKIVMAYFQTYLLGTKINAMELIPFKLLKHNGFAYVVSNERPENGDWVLTENYGAWEFKDETGSGSAPLPYWANRNTCKKIEASDDKSLHEKCPTVRLILKK